MQSGLVIGTATATVKHHTLEGEKLLVVQPLLADGRSPDGEPVLAVDRLSVGAGETVIITSDGKTIREMLGDTTPVRWSVLGIPDLQTTSLAISQMRIGKVIGCVTLSRWHPSLGGAAYKLAVPLTKPELTSDAMPAGEELVVYDDLGAGLGETIAISEGGEAAQPFAPDDKPIDAYNAAILDHIHLSSTNP